MPSINVDELVSKVREVAKENPTFVYTKKPHDDQSFSAGGCEYTPDKMNPYGCIIGAGLLKMGIDTTQPPWNDNEPIDTILEGEAFTHYKQVKWLHVVQDCQDNGHPWGQAVETADREE